jgi:hypothetical protein
MLFIELGGPEKPMGWASMKSLSGPAHGLEPTAQQLRPLLHTAFKSCGRLLSATSESVVGRSRMIKRLLSSE